MKKELIKNENLLVIGHRGAMGYETENTLSSVQKALDFDVDAIEIDVFKIETEEIIVFHDSRVERLTNGFGKIENKTLAQVKKLTLKGGHMIPLLEDVIKLIDGSCKLNIELKGAGTAKEVKQIIDKAVNNKSWKEEDFIISSFNWDELRSYRQLDEKALIAILTEGNPIKAIPVAKELNAIAINPNYKDLTPENISEIHKEGFKVYTWTVNKPKHIEKMKRLGVDGIFTNYPDRIEKVVEE
ncbi:glycerophosphodiester phosphodiesterase [Leptobacterium sp. I13]|uniref:glycerophosphodiester phosphodiesterase n=1 Tax=Leptobacterium meishanense TaxID=3128904 RepID=UPI0030ED4205